MAAALSSTPVSSPAFAWTPPAAEEVAGWFPDYEVQALAGRGAMGAVYRAVQRKLERPVAIKLLPAELAARDGVEARFQREARALAQLNHPGIVALHDFGRTAGGHLFIVMEYVDGTDLSRLIHAEGGGLQVAHALEIVGQVCDALQYAHSRGFVHRDIKPGNVLVDKDGRVKIADFGLAKLVARHSNVEPAPGQHATLESRATLTGQALGTPDYTAPEQLKGGPVDHRADIYSLGVMFYEMLTGDLPRGAWTPPSRCTAAPERLDEVVTRAMQSEPNRRYQQASEVKAAAVGAGPPPPAGPNPAGSAVNRVLLWLMAAFIIAACFITPTGDALTTLMLAAPFVALALYFKMKRRPAGLVSVLIAGMAMGATVFLAVLQFDELGKIQGPAKFDAESPDSRKWIAISPVQSARVAEFKVTAGQHVVPGTVVAVMDQSRIRLDLQALKDEVLERWQKEMDAGQREILTLEAELRQAQTAESEDNAVIKELEAQVERTERLGGGNLGDLMKHSEANQRSRTELVKAKGRNALSAAHLAGIQDSLQDLRSRKELPAKAVGALNKAEMGDEKVVPLLPLSASERQRRSSLLQSLQDCELTTAHGGVVEKVHKSAGEYCAAGETILTIVPAEDSDRR